MGVYFTSDTHFGRAAIIDYCQRPYTSVVEMNRDLAARWNATVSMTDVVYHLGDVMWWSKDHKTIPCLNGQVKLVPGHHDTPQILRYLTEAWQWEILPPVTQVGSATLCHYPLRSWVRKYQLHGHSHGTLRALPNQLDVGVDAQHLAPLSEFDVWRLIEEDLNGRV